MCKRRGWTVLLVAVVAVLSLLPGELWGSASSDEVVEMVQARYNELSTISARFRQLSVNKVSSLREESWGKVYISKPGKMRWEYEKPERKLIVSDGQKVWTYLPEQNQVYVARLDEAYVSRTPLAFFAGKGNLKEGFEIAFSSVKDDRGELVFRLDLRPHKPRMNLSRLVLEVDSKSYLIVKSDLYDSMGNLISIKFDQILIDLDIPQRLFRFSPPPGAEVVELGKGR